MSNPQQLSYNFTRRAVLRIQKTRRKGYHTYDELSGGFHSDILAFCSRLLKPQTSASVRGLKRRSGGGSALRLIKKSKQAIQRLLQLGAEGGIRTLEPVKATRFPIVRLRPLGQSSAQKRTRGVVDQRLWGVTCADGPAAGGVVGLRNTAGFAPDWHLEQRGKRPASSVVGARFTGRGAINRSLPETTGWACGDARAVARGMGGHSVELAGRVDDRTSSTVVERPAACAVG